MKHVLTVILISFAMLFSQVDSRADNQQLQAACLPLASIPDWCAELKEPAKVLLTDEKAREALFHGLTETMVKNAGDVSRMAVLDRLAMQYQHACLCLDAFSWRSHELKTQDDLFSALEASQRLREFRRRFPSIVTDELLQQERAGADECLQEWTSLFDDAEPDQPISGNFKESASADGVLFLPVDKCGKERIRVYRVSMEFAYQPSTEETVTEVYLNLGGMPRNAVVYMNGVMQARLPLHQRHSFRIPMPDADRATTITLCYEYVGDKPATLPFTPWISVRDNDRRDRGR